MAERSGGSRSRIFLARLSFWVFSLSGALTSFLGWVLVEERLSLEELRFWEWQPGKFGLAAVAFCLLSGLPAGMLGWWWRERGYPRRAAAACSAPPLVAALIFSIHDVTVVDGFLAIGGPAIGCGLWSLLGTRPRRWKPAIAIVLVVAGLLAMNAFLILVEGALLRAAASGDLETASLILESGFDVDARNLDGMSPLMAAVEAEDADMISLLLDWQASPYRRDASGDSPMLRSIELRSTGATVLMLDFFGTSEPDLTYEPEETSGPSV